MANIEDCPGFETFGADVKAARNAKHLSRRALAEIIDIDSRYLANIENEDTIPALPVIIQLIKVCGLPVERYEIKRGKYISARAPNQERFTRLKTLGVDYTEEALAARIAGRSRPSRQPKQQNGKISLLIDIQNNIKAQQSAGFTHWAKLNNLKQAAKTINFLTEHGINSYEKLVERCDAVAAASIRTRESLRDTEQRIADLALLGKQIDTYRKLKSVYDRYKASKDKEKFLRGFESEIILFEAAAREIKKAGLTKLPSTEKLKAELDGLAARKTALQAELRKIQQEEKKYGTLQKNIRILLEKTIKNVRKPPGQDFDNEL